MPKMHPNEQFIRDMVDELSIILGLPKDVVRSVINGIELYSLHKLYERGLQDQELGRKEMFNLQVPLIGQVEFIPVNYPETENSILNGRALRSRFTVRDNFLTRARHAYYNGDDYLTDAVKLTFTEQMKTKYTKLLREECDIIE